MMSIKMKIGTRVIERGARRIRQGSVSELDWPGIKIAWEPDGEINTYELVDGVWFSTNKAYGVHEVRLQFEEEPNPTLEKLRKIARQVDGEAAVGNEAAAMNMAATLQRLLAKYSISKGQLEQDTHDDPIQRHRISWEKWGVKPKQKRVAWTETLAEIVAEAMGCYTLIHPGTNMITLVGRGSTILVCEQTLAMLVKSTENLSQMAYDNIYYQCQRDGTMLPIRYKAGWIDGFIWRINERLRDEMDPTKHADLDTQKETSSAIVAIDTQRKAARDYIDALDVPSAPGLYMGRGSSSGERDGRAAADKLNLSGHRREKLD